MIQRFLSFLNNLPARLPFTCSFILIYLLVMTFCSTAMLQLGKAPGTAADAALLPFLFGILVTQISVVITVIIFAIEMIISKQKAPLERQNPLSYLFWLLLLLGLLPIVGMYGPFVLALTGANKQLAEVPYLFATPTQKLKHDITLGRFKNIKEDLAQGADINAQDPDRHQTALIWAISTARYSFAHDLINNKANIYLKDAYGKDALAEALTAEKISNSIAWTPHTNPQRAQIALKLINMGAKIHQVKPGECSELLSGAVMTGNQELANKVLQAGLNVNRNKTFKPPTAPNHLGDYYGTTPPLSIAAMEGNNAMIEFLLKQGANVNAIDDADGTTPLMHAIQQQHADTAKLLISKGANVNAQSHSKETPLMIAVIYRLNNELITSLIQAGADVNANVKEGSPVLARAIMTGDIANVKTLLIHGARLNPKSKYGSELLENAIYGHNPELVKFLLQKGIKPTTDHLVTALEKNQPEITELFLKAGVNPNTPAVLEGNRYNQIALAPLFQAIWENNPDLVRLLLKHGADSHVRGSLLEGPIEAAVMLPATEKTLIIIQLLLDQGANINQLDYYGNTALDVVMSRKVQFKNIESEYNFLKKIEALLKEHGGKTNRPQH